MKEKFIKFAWYFLIWFLFMIFTVVVAKPLADNNFPVPTSSLLINTIICFLIPYIIYRKFMDYKKDHDIKIKNIFGGVAIYFVAIFCLSFVLYINDKPRTIESNVATAKIENVAEEEKLAAEQKAREEQEKLAAEQKVREEQEKLAAEQKAREEQEKLAAEQKAREEQEKLAAEQKAREEQEKSKGNNLTLSGLFNKIKTGVEDIATAEFEELTAEEIFVGNTDNGVISYDIYILPDTTRPLIDGIIFETREGFIIDMKLKDPDTNEVIGIFPIYFYNSNDFWAPEGTVKYKINKNESKSPITDEKIIIDIYNASKKFSILK